MFKKVTRTLLLSKLLETESSEYQVQLVDKESEIKSAQRLHASVYLERGFIESEIINKDGRIARKHDPYSAHAEYFRVVKFEGNNASTIATARMIKHHPEKGRASFPTLEKLVLFPRAEDRVNSAELPSSFEISGLAKTKGQSSYAALLLYRSMWQYSVKHNHKYWVMACDSNVYFRLKSMFGKALEEIGREQFYMGSKVIPAILEIDGSLELLSERSSSWNLVRSHMKKKLIRFFLRGLPDSYSPTHEKNSKRYLSNDR